MLYIYTQYNDTQYNNNQHSGNQHLDNEEDNFDMFQTGVQFETRKYEYLEISLKSRNII